MEKRKFRLPAGLDIVLSFLMIIMNQLFAFIGGTVFFRTIFHVPIYIGVIIVGFFYFFMIVLFCNMT